MFSGLAGTGAAEGPPPPKRGDADPGRGGGGPADGAGLLDTRVLPLVTRGQPGASQASLVCETEGSLRRTHRELH